MGQTTNMQPTQQIYRGPGTHSVRTVPCENLDPGTLKIPTIADAVPVTWIMSRDVVCACEDLEVGTLMGLMIRRRIGCMPIIDERGHPTGMVTKLDLVEQVLAAREPEAAAPALVASELMMPLALTLDEHATIAHAAAMMSIEDVHHVPIVASNGCLIGVVSTMDIIRWLASNDGIRITDQAR